ncbi:MAG TPA: TetR/AcrR family transcriptional regulator [Caulobacteraceae bacterium]|nr:TetR/AcrR family transcriptional regulator [Caulobacteraceae bacterium]
MIDKKTVPPVQSAGRSKGERTRERILDLAFDAVIAKGFAATSIEELVEAAGITKSGFFYHFRDKTDLAHQMLERYFDENEQLLDKLTHRARELSDDPLHSLLIYLKLFAEVMTDLAAEHPGCIVATVTFQEAAFDREVARMNTQGVLAWRERNETWLRKIVERYPMNSEVDLQDLADQLMAVTIGAIAVSKATRDPALVGRQAMLFRDYVRLLFSR